MGRWARILKHRWLDETDVARALEANNANQGARYLEENGEAYVVRAAGLGGERAGTAWKIRELEILRVC